MTFDSNEFKTRANNFNSRLITMVLVENPKNNGIKNIYSNSMLM